MTFYLKRIYSLLVLSLVASASLSAEPLQNTQADTLASSHTLNYSSMTQSLLRLSHEQYLELKALFEKSYRNIEFNTKVTQNYFDPEAEYNLLTLPIAQQHADGFQLEFFGQLYDESLFIYRNIHKDSIYYDMGREQLLLRANNSSIATGFSFAGQISPRTHFQALLSSHEVPGFGDSHFVFGIDVRY